MHPKWRQACEIQEPEATPKVKGSWFQCERKIEPTRTGSATEVAQDGTARGLRIHIGPAQCAGGRDRDIP